MSTIVAFPHDRARQLETTIRGELADTGRRAARAMIAAFALAQESGANAAGNVVDFTLYRWAARRADQTGPAGAGCRASARVSTHAVGTAALPLEAA